MVHLQGGLTNFNEYGCLPPSNQLRTQYMEYLRKFDLSGDSELNQAYYEITHCICLCLLTICFYTT